MNPHSAHITAWRHREKVYSIFFSDFSSLNDLMMRRIIFPKPLWNIWFFFFVLFSIRYQSSMYWNSFSFCFGHFTLFFKLGCNWYQYPNPPAPLLTSHSIPFPSPTSAYLQIDKKPGMLGNRSHLPAATIFLCYRYKRRRPTLCSAELQKWLRAVLFREKRTRHRFRHTLAFLST